MMEEERRPDPDIELEGVSRPSHHTDGQGGTVLLTILLLGTQEGEMERYVHRKASRQH